MSASIPAGFHRAPSEATELMLPARPEPIRINPARTAIIVVDMQNAYASEGGYIDIAGFDVSGAKATISKTRQVLDAARAAGVLVIFFQNGWDNWHKSNALKTMRARPELEGTLLAKGGWDYALIDDLPVEPGDIVVPKTRYSGFFNTNMDSVLRARDIRTLVFCGVATNVCVESSLRDAFHLEYFPILLEDACNHAGPDFVRQAAIYNVEKFFGWVSTVNDFCSAVKQTEPAAG